MSAEREALIAAILRITRDAANDQPNGRAEAAIDRTLSLVNASRSPTVEPFVVEVCDAMADLCEALADDTHELRVAAEAFFGGNFTSGEMGAQS